MESLKVISRAKRLLPGVLLASGLLMVFVGMMEGTSFYYSITIALGLVVSVCSWIAFHKNDHPEPREHLPRIGNVEKFVTTLVRSGLTTEEDAIELVDRFRNEHLPASNTPDTITALCTFLIATGTLTSWQCEKLRQGKWKGFFDFDNFVMLDILGSDADLCYCLARDIEADAIVCLAVTPLSRSKSGKSEFRVEQRLT